MPLLAAPSAHRLTTRWAPPLVPVVYPMSVGRPGEDSSYYDEWWLSIILTWKHPLLFWLGVANEGCIAKLPSYPSTHFSALSFAFLPSLTLLPSSLPVPVCIVGVVIRPLQHPDLMQRSAVCCFSVSVTECSRNCHGIKLVPNGSALPAPALHPWKDTQLYKSYASLTVWTWSGVVLLLYCEVKKWRMGSLASNVCRKDGKGHDSLKRLYIVVHVYLCHVERCPNCAFNPWSKSLNTEHLPVLVC